jgi:hypothetical protein
MRLTTIVLAVASMATFTMASPTVDGTSPNINVMTARDDCKPCEDYYNKCRAVGSSHGSQVS